MKKGRNVVLTEITQKVINEALIYTGERNNPGTDPSQALALREARRITDPIFNKLWRFLYQPQRPVQLTDFEEEMKKRLLNMWHLLTAKVLNDRKAVLAHVAWCKENFMAIHEGTAYDDLRKAKMLFGDPSQNNAILEKARISTVLLDLIEKAKHISEQCAVDKDYEMAAKLFEITQRLIRRYNAVNGIEMDQKSALPRTAIQINFNSDEATLKKKASDLMKGVATDADTEE